MDESNMLSQIIDLLDALGTIGLLVYMLYVERGRADALMGYILDDWRQQRHRD